MAEDPSETTEDEHDTSHPVAEGKAAKTPFVAIGATSLIVAVIFVLALALAGLAYWLAG